MALAKSISMRTIRSLSSTRRSGAVGYARREYGSPSLWKVGNGSNRNGMPRIGFLSFALSLTTYALYFQTALCKQGAAVLMRPLIRPPINPTINPKRRLCGMSPKGSSDVMRISQEQFFGLFKSSALPPIISPICRSSQTLLKVPALVHHDEDATALRRNMQERRHDEAMRRPMKEYWVFQWMGWLGCSAVGITINLIAGGKLVPLLLTHVFFVGRWNGPYTPAAP
jgi:hypothetical protein